MLYQYGQTNILIQKVAKINDSLNQYLYKFVGTYGYQ